MGVNFKTIFILLFFGSLMFQIKIFDKNNPASCIKAFKNNNLSGLFIFLSLITN